MKLLNKAPVNHKVLLHLQEYQHYRDRFEVPFAITQMGIAESVFIHRAAAARALNNMKAKGLILSQTKHVIRGNRNRKAYFLTYEGINAVKEVEQNLLESSIKLRGKMGSEQEVMEIRALLKSRGERTKLLDVCNILENGILEPEALEDGGHATKGGQESAQGDDDGQTTFFFSPDIPEQPHFAGRRKELDQMHQAIAEGTVSAIVLQGIAGIGKTSLAAQVASRLRGTRHVHFLEIQPWTGFQSFVSRLLGTLLGREKASRTFKALNTMKTGAVNEIHADTGSEWDFEALLEQTLGYLGKSPNLLILDDVHNADGNIRDFIGALLGKMKGSHGSHIILTSRTLPDFYDRRLVFVEKRILEITLSGLNFEEAFELMNLLISGKEARYLGNNEPVSATFPGDNEHMSVPSSGDNEHMSVPSSGDNEHMSVPSPGELISSPMPLSEENFKRTYAETQGHPFALELVSSMGVPSARVDFDRFLSEEIIDKLQDKERSILSYCTVFRMSLDMSVLLDFIPESAISMIQIEGLLKRNLLRERDGRFSIHAIIRDFMGSRLSPEHVEHCHRTAVRYYAKKSQLLNEKWNRQEDVHLGKEDFWENEHEFVIEQIYHLLKLGEHEAAAVLIRDWADEFITFGNGEFLNVLQLFDIDVIEVGMRKELIEIIGDTQAEFGNIEKAIERYGERMEYEKKGSLGEARILRKIGDMEVERGDLDASIRLKERSLKIVQGRKDLRRTAMLLNELGLDHWKNRQMKEARSSFLKGVALLADAGERYELSRMLLNLAQLESEERNHMKADNYLKQSLSKARNEEEKIEIYHLMGDFSLQLGERKKALFNYKKGLKLAISAKDYRETVNLVELVSEMYLSEGKKKEALEILTNGIALVEEGAREPGSTRGMQISFLTRERRSEETGRGITREPERIEKEAHPDRARPSLQTRQSRTSDLIKNDNYRFSALCEKAALILEENGDWDSSIEYFSKALNIAHNFQHHQKAARLLLRIGRIKHNTSNGNEAIRCYRDAYVLFERANDVKGCAISLLNFSAALEREVDADRGKRTQLVKLYIKAQSLSEKVGYEKGVELASNKLKHLASLE